MLGNKRNNDNDNDIDNDNDNISVKSVKISVCGCDYDRIVSEKRDLLLNYQKLRCDNGMINREMIQLKKQMMVLSNDLISKKKEIDELAIINYKKEIENNTRLKADDKLYVDLYGERYNVDVCNNYKIGFCILCLHDDVKVVKLCYHEKCSANICFKCMIVTSSDLDKKRLLIKCPQCRDKSIIN